MTRDQPIKTTQLDPENVLVIVLVVIPTFVLHYKNDSNQSA